MSTMTSSGSTSSTTGHDTLLASAAANGSFKTFGKAIEQAGLSQTLNGSGPFTVFAPTDAAFDKLPSGKLDSLLKPENKTELASILNYHVVSGRNSAADVGKWQTAKTVNGQAAPIKLEGSKVFIGGAEVSKADIGCSNGVIHGIDRVIMPAASINTQ